MNHFTNLSGYHAIGSQAIGSQPDWVFNASTPPGDHPHGAYFTILEPNQPKLACRLRIPRAKVAYYFAFTADDSLLPLPGGRGEYIFYSPGDHTVPRQSQGRHGPTGL